MLTIAAPAVQTEYEQSAIERTLRPGGSLVTDSRREPAGHP